MKKAIVVGSGFGGIASALRLKALGYDVRVFEKLESIRWQSKSFQELWLCF